MDQELLIAYGDVYLDWDLGAGDQSHPTNPQRAEIATSKLVECLAGRVQIVEPTSAATLQRDLRALGQAASAEHIERVMQHHQSSEWTGASEANANAAFAMFAGTVRLVDALIDGTCKVGFNPQGAKHHARFDRPAGFCEFNDMAWAARELQRHGLRPLYLDWDIHAGDGVFDDLKGSGIPALSIHTGQTYPFHPEMKIAGQSGRYTVHNPLLPAYNWNIGVEDGDDALLWAMQEAIAVIDEYRPDVILLAAGADGHRGVNALGLRNTYSYDGFDAAAEMIAAAARRHAQGRVIIGGAGGYQPLDHTPEIWARVVERIYLNS